MNNQELDNVINLPSAKRYKYFISKVVDEDKVWGLYRDGWALAGDENETPLLALWPAREYAELCKEQTWSDYTSVAINLHDFMQQHIGELKVAGIGLAIFYTPSNKGIEVSYSKFIEDLQKELSRVE